MQINVCLFEYQNNLSFIWRRQHRRRRGAKRSFLGAYGLRAGWDLYRAVTRDFGVCGLIRRMPHSVALYDKQETQGTYSHQNPKGANKKN